MPELEKLGLGKIERIPGIISSELGQGESMGEMAEASPGKDTTTGHSGTARG